MRKLLAFFKDWRAQSGYFVWLMRYSKPFLGRMTILLIIDILLSLSSVVLALVSKHIIDTSVQGANVMVYIGAYVVVVLLSELLTVVSSLMSVMVNERFSFGIRKQLYEKIIHCHWMDVKKYHTGDLMTRLTSDAGNIADGIIYTIPSIIQLIVELLVTFCTLFYFEPLLAVLALLIAPIAALVSVLVGRRLKKLQIKVQQTEAAYRSYLQESLANLLVVKSFANEEYAVDRLVDLREDRFKWVLKKNRLGVVSSTIMGLAFQLGYIAAYTVGSIQLSRNEISYGTMSVFITLVNRVQAPIMGLAQNLPKIVSILASAGRIIELENMEEEERAEDNIDTTQVGVEMKNVTFGYVPMEHVLEEASLTIRPGEFVAIVGESGIGKTTLIRLIMSFMSNYDGTITFTNARGEKETANALTRQFISYVPQGNTLFSGTIRENIHMGALGATEEEMIEALKLASAYDFVMELPNGIDTVIGERGHGISEGQAQRIAIARALVRKAPFLVLDEATSSLDEKTELAVLQGIQNLTPKPTCLLITHRRSVLSYCDREIRLSNGKIEEITE